MVEAKNQMLKTGEVFCANTGNTQTLHFRLFILKSDVDFSQEVADCC